MMKLSAMFKQVVNDTDFIFNFGSANDCCERTFWIDQVLCLEHQALFPSKTGYCRDDSVRFLLSKHVHGEQHQMHR